jgi:bacterial leucyl aminopeptidase
MNKVTVVFFDIGDTLGSPKISPPPYHLESLNIYPYIPGILQQLKSDRLRLGMISNTGNETEASMKKVLEASGIYNFFDPNLLIYSSVVGISKLRMAILQQIVYS